jgi:hypothetical protein
MLLLAAAPDANAENANQGECGYTAERGYRAERAYTAVKPE